MQTPVFNPWARLRWPAILLIGILAYGIGAYMGFEGWSFVDAFYMTMLTLTTVGLEEARPLDTSGEMITISLMVMGVTLVVITLSLAATAIAEGGLGETNRRSKMRRQIDELEGHYIVCAYGRVGRTVARELKADGAEVVVIDPKEDLEELMTRDRMLFLTADPSSEDVLRAAGVTRARGLISAVDSDAANVFITLAARALNPDLFIVARAAEQGTRPHLYNAGADRVVSPYVTSGRHMAVAALRPRVVDYFEVGARDETGLRIEEVEVARSSPLVGRTVAAACRGTTALAIRRADGEVIPNPEPSLELCVGDLLVLMGERDALRAFEQG